MENMVYMYAMEYYSALKRREILTHAIKWMKLEGTVLSKITTHRRTDALGFELHVETTAVKFTET